MKKILSLAIFITLSIASIAVIADNIEDYNKGVKAYQSGDYKTAVKWYTLAAEQGVVYAQYNLGVMYYSGEGVLKNDKTAVKWYTLAAEQGDADGQYHLGVMYDQGEGVLENDKTAVKWYTLAAEQGYAGAQNNLGIMYALGEGVLTDTKRAYMWYNIGAYNGNDLSAKNKDILAKSMSPTQIDKAQNMTIHCMASDYRDC